MAAELIVEQAPEPRAALTARGEAAVHLIRFEEAWAALGAEDRAYFAGTLEQLAREIPAEQMEAEVTR